MAIEAFNKETLRQQVGFKFNDETSKILHFNQIFVRCWHLGTSEISSEISAKFFNVVLEKVGEDQLGRSCQILSIIQGNILRALKRSESY